MNAKELIKLNNKKRKGLTEENEEYYDKMLVYIRTNVSVSEQQAEELLMELLDHLIDAQAEGKGAAEIFGENIKNYCDEMIKQLPKEPLKSTAFFIGFLLLQLASLMAIVSGIGDIVVHYFKDSSQTVYVGTALVTLGIVAVIISLDVFLFLKWIQKSVYKITNKIKDFFLLFVLIFVSLAGMVFLPKLIPPFGYAIEAGGFLYLTVGAATLIVLKWLNSKYQITK